MNLQRLPEHLTTATAVVIGGLVSYWFGILVGEGSVGTILTILAGFSLLGLLLGLRQHVWVLIPLAWPFGQMLPLVPAHPALREAVIMAVFASTLMLMAVKAVRLRPKFASVDFWLAAVLLYVFVTWVRHPTGGLLLRSDRIGGRAYFSTMVSCAAYFVLSRAWLPKKWKGDRVLTVVMAFYVLPGIVGCLGALSPTIGSKIATYYGGIDFREADTLPATGPVDPLAPTMNRRVYLQSLGLPAVQWLLARFRPLTLINPLFPGRTLFFVVSVLTTLMGGFRSTLLSILGYMLLASWLRRGSLEAVRLGVLGAGAAAALALSSYAVKLPIPIQRSLSFLPGHWDAFAVAEAKDSTDWRLDMWKRMLSSDRYIQNRWLGDGFGFTMQQYEVMMTPAGTMQAQENFLIVGEVHSGPISAIRYVGYFGLLLYICLMVAVAREGIRLCRQTLGTDLGPLTWFLCLPLIWEPFNYLLIFGTLDAGLPTEVYYAALVKMLRLSLEMREPDKEKPAAPVLPARRPERIVRPQWPGRPLTVPLP